nr:hypothetical protein B0A51_03506 [Rachicladosporium sp. CCFEE 5018]
MHRRIFAAVHAMLSRTYFERVWVAQELYMASKPMLLCGADQCAMAALEGLLAISSISDFGRGRSDGAWLNKHFYRYRTTKVWQRMFHAVTHHLDDAGELKKSGLPTLLHYGGSRNKLPETSLSRMVQTIHPLHCSDPRDIIYATLGLLDPQVASRISVDYHKTTFGLATEVIPMFFDEVAAQLELDGAIDHGGSQAGTLLRMLRPSDDDAHYSRAIAVRTHREQQHVQGSAPLSGDRTRTKVNHWSGHRIWCCGSTWRMGLNQPTTIANTTETPPGSHPGLVKVESKRGHLLAILPNNVRNGDWLLQTASPWQLVCPGLVLRSTAEGVLDIISTAVFIRSELASEGPGSATAFTINFDTEDLATCLFHFTSFWRRPGPAPQLPARPAGVETIVSPDLPSGVYRPPEIIEQNLAFYYADSLYGKSRADFADYFAVHPCCESGSSYGEAVMAEERRRAASPENLLLVITPWIEPKATEIWPDS